LTGADLRLIILNTFNMTYAKSEITATRILDAALGLFRTKGFDRTTMRDIAAAAGMATGTAYHHFASKEAMVMAFYQRSCDEMQPLLESSLLAARGLEQQLLALIRTKLEYFQPNRAVLKALLRNGADPQHPLSPFSTNTQAIRDTDVAWFRRVVADVSLPRDLAPHVPDVLWLFQMGVIYFWITDTSAAQKRTARLLEISIKVVVLMLRLANLPLTRPLRKPVLELIEITKGAA
jgi:AcrR family transcriptional regulator